MGDFECAKKLQDIISRLDNKSCTRLKNGEIFSKQDLQKPHRTLTHSSALTCRTTSGRLRGPTAMCFYFFFVINVLFNSIPSVSFSVLQMFLRCSSQMFWLSFRRKSRSLSLLHWYRNIYIYIVFFSVPEQVFVHIRNQNMNSVLNILCLQEQKPSVMPLRRLIVREVANQERGLFLISGDCSVGPEMYEIHTQTREERNMWMTLLRQAADRCVRPRECFY